VGLSADIYWSFRSPYSYLAMQRYRTLAAEHDVHLNLRLVYPLAIRQPDFFEKNHPNWSNYVRMDVIRLAEYWGIPFHLPQPDPIVQNLETRAISPDQPHIYRLVRLGQVAVRHGKGIEFADAVSRLIWGGVKGWNEGQHLADAAQELGLDFEALESEAAKDAAALDAEIAANQAALEATGHWGVPTLVFDNEPFFGQDRIDIAFWRIENNEKRRKEDATR
jgi:2-hydroxychromene-2-carboxylate isomerase